MFFVMLKLFRIVVFFWGHGVLHEISSITSLLLTILAVRLKSSCSLIPLKDA